MKSIKITNMVKGEPWRGRVVTAFRSGVKIEIKVHVRAELDCIKHINCVESYEVLWPANGGEKPGVASLFATAILVAAEEARTLAALYRNKRLTSAKPPKRRKKK